MVCLMIQLLMFIYNCCLSIIHVEVVSMCNKKNQFLCSLHKDGTRYLNLVHKFLECKWNEIYKNNDELRNKFRSHNNKDWELINSRNDVPHQGPTLDCGIYLCMFTNVISRGLSYTSLNSDVVQKRGRMHIMSSIVNEFSLSENM